MTPTTPTIPTTLSGSGRVFAILDALDECPARDGERYLLLSTLSQIHGWNIPGLRLLLTSRVEDDIWRHVTARLSTQPIA